jgi:peptidoglycan/LPS O-acetylase OafA/YrhL
LLISAATKYFPNLDGLRFVGAMTILLLHIEDIKAKQGQEVISWIRYFDNVGEYAVSLFFVLSGFLITYLLLQEKENTSTINLKKFYTKRVLKIWPLYLLIGFIGFFLLPRLDTYFHWAYSQSLNEHFWLYLILYCLFLPVTALSDTIGIAWSVRVEEIFYFFWPLLLRRTKNYLRLFIWIVAGVVVFRLATKCLAIFTLNQMVTDIAILARAYRVSCMAIGGIGAYLVVKENKKILDFIYRVDVQLLVYALMAAQLIFNIYIPYVEFEFSSVLFACMIVNLATNPKSLMKLDYKWINYLGKVSYGIYMYNAIMRILCLQAIEHIFKSKVIGWQLNLLMYSATIASTLIISILSFELFEKRFLNMKKTLAA